MDTNLSTATIVSYSPAFIDYLSSFKRKEIIQQSPKTSIINIASLAADMNKPLSILPSVNPNEQTNVSENHDAQPIKLKKHISQIVNYYLSNKQYRDAMLFIVGINFGLRVSDLRELRFKDLIDEKTMTFKDRFNVSEKKTRNTRGKKKNMLNLNKLRDMTQEEKVQYLLYQTDEEIDTQKSKTISKPRTIYINNAVRNIVALYLSNTTRQTTLDDYLFVAEQSNNKKMLQLSYTDTNGEIKYLDKYVQSPMTDSAIDPILKNTTEALNIKGRYSTHAYRKTFAYHILMQTPTTEINNKPNERQLEFLQGIFGHSNSSTTLHYAGMTEDEIQAAYMNLNLGLDDISNYLNNN